MFSGLPKLADKTFIIGFLVPALLTAGAVLVGFRECAWVGAAARDVASAADLGKLTLLGAEVILGALLLLLLNRPVYRALEGYIPPFDHPLLKDRARQEWQTWDEKRRKLRSDAEAPAEECERDKAVIAYREYLLKFRRTYPKLERNVLPTRFGNANRAFENYPANVYDAEGIIFWPRLSVIFPKSLQETLADARAQVNCFVNIAVLASIVAAARIALWIVEGAWRFFGTPAARTGSLDAASFSTGAVGIVLLLLASRAAYEMAIERVMTLGDQVKVAFDLYLPQLPAQLGYVLPSDAAGRRNLWAALEEAYQFQNPVKGVIYAPSPPASVLPATKAEPPRAEESGNESDEAEAGG